MNAVTKARRVNNNLKAIGDHFTLTRIVNEPENSRVFGYAISDDGVEAYVPASIINGDNLSEHDVGAGFRAPTVPNPRAVTQGLPSSAMVQFPVVWDGALEPVVVEDAEEDLVRLAEATDDMIVAIAAELSDAIAMIGNFEVKQGIEQIASARDKLEAYRAFIDELCPSDGG